MQAWNDLFNNIIWAYFVKSTRYKEYIFKEAFKAAVNQGVSLVSFEHTLKLVQE